MRGAPEGTGGDRVTDLAASAAFVALEDNRRDMTVLLAAVRWARAPHVIGPERGEVHDLRARLLDRLEWRCA